jgi:ribonuclease Y
MELMIAAGLLAAAIVVAALVMRSRPVAAPDPARARAAAEPAITVPPAAADTADRDAPPVTRNGSGRPDADTGAHGPGRTGQWPRTDVDASAAAATSTRRNGAPNGAHAAVPAGAAAEGAPAPGAGAAPAPGAVRVGSARASAASAAVPAVAAPAAAPDAGYSPAMEASLARRLEEIDRRERRVGDREHELDGARAKLQAAHEQLVRELERISGMSASQAKQALLKDVEDDARHERALVLRQVEEETKRDAERRVRSILSVAMQRLAASHATETTVSVVSLPSDDMKGRIIGKEGRNIRALETLTGVDVIIDDTPNAVVLSAFDGVRREVARMTLEKLLQDGRIHPARIEETYYQAKSQLEAHMRKVGEDAVLEADVHGLDPELIKLLGRLRFRTSYGQNVLAHSVECAHLAASMAHELGASPKTARRAALLHDIGKAVSHEIEGPHALVGGNLARRHGEPEAVAHAMEAHHNEVEPQTVEAVIVQTADALSGARPGARGESLEHYVKRLRELEQLAERHPGVDKVYAMQAGREIRVIVAPGAVDDDGAALLARAVARDIERELEYPGQIKVTVIRESRAVDYAK